jgi:dynactin-5
MSDGFIKTTTHNYVSRKAIIDGAKQVEIKGRSIIQDEVKVRGDLAIVRIGRYCVIGRGSLVEPPVHPLNKSNNIPLVIGSHTHIGSECEIRAAAVGSMVWIGDNVKLGKRCIIKDNCVIESGIEIGDDTIVPPFTRIYTNTTTDFEELPPSVAVQLQEVSISNYDEFKQSYSQ